MKQLLSNLFPIAVRKALFSLTRRLGWFAAKILGTVRSPSYVTEIEKDRVHLFMGYYDLKYRDGEILYMHSVETKYGNSTNPMEAEILAYNFRDSSFKKITTTRAMNWQIGSRLQVVDKHLYYNDINVSGHIHSVGLNLVTGAVEKYPFPIWNLHPETKVFFSIDYERIVKVRPGYGYSGNMLEEFKRDVVLISQESRAIIFRISLSSVIARYNLIPETYFCHIACSPSGRYLVVEATEESPDRRRITPIVVDLEKDQMSTFDPGLTLSHLSFVDDDRVLFFDGVGYCIVRISTQEKEYIYLCSSDGHPTLQNDVLLTDTYPDRFARMELWQVIDGKRKVLARVPSNPIFEGDLRCDFHPKLDDKSVYIDLPNSQRRKIGIISLD